MDAMSRQTDRIRKRFFVCAAPTRIARLALLECHCCEMLMF